MKLFTQQGFTSLLAIIFIFVTGVIGAYYLRKSAIPISILQTNQNTKYQIAVRIGSYTKTSPPNLKADLWIMNSDGSNKKQITKTNNIARIFNWSPDNSKVAAGLANGKLAVVETSSGEIKELGGIDVFGNPLIKWLSDKELVRVSTSSNNERILEKVPVNGAKPQLLYKLPIDNVIRSESEYYSSDTLIIKFSPKIEWMAVEQHPCCEGPYFTPSLYAYNLKTGSKQKLLEEDGIVLQGWKEDQILLTRNNYEIWQVDPINKKLSQILEDQTPIQDAFDSPGKIFDVVSSKDNNYLLYGRNVGWQQFYLSHYTSGQKILVAKQLFNDSVDNILLSPDNSFIVYAQRSGTHDEITEPVVCFVKFIRDDYPIKLTTEPCYYPVISN